MSKKINIKTSKAFDLAFEEGNDNRLSKSESIELILLLSFSLLPLLLGQATCSVKHDNNERERNGQRGLKVRTQRGR